MGRLANGRRTQKIGLAPGSLIFLGDQKSDSVTISVFDYSAEKISEYTPTAVPDLKSLVEPGTTSWMNVTGLHDVETIRNIGEIFHLHPLTQEDILNTGQRPKVEIFDNYIFVVLRMISFDPGRNELVSEQVSIILGKTFVLTFQERDGDVFNFVRSRIRAGKTRIRSLGNDYLAYALMDAVVDHYFVVLEQIGEVIESLEEDLIATVTETTLQSIHRLKREAILLRRSIWPLREAIGLLEREETNLISLETHLYLRDLYDHTIQVMETVETYRDIIAGMLDLYLSGMSNRMNEVMKVLTIFATIFIPLTFVAGVYGMNFKFMPELEWVHGYAAVWCVMIMIAGGLIFYFKRKRWF
ncbi:MAG TPA: magnesium/cobalt transporter CorA [Thermoanaerobaculia bacterium]|nr:magnesium/cobalt transporter CorA [Thermoanaerobaculia bacterium]HUM30087.1 magnesium/cobalt transporter CorA [Thermoanaerobaculia bacterium]HXK68784.1 magnesium/cobalt transporter CorA [Thermoanaerobaculia bacterium]